MSGLCRKDVLYHKVCMLSLGGINILYLVIYLLGAEDLDDVLWKAEAAYLILLALIIPIIMYRRYGDNSRQIIHDVVYTKLRQEQTSQYQILYILWLLIAGAAAGGGTQLICFFTSDYDIKRGLLFWGNAAAIAFIYILLFLVMIYLINKYIWAVICYVLAFYCLMLYQAPESVLRFLYLEENPMYGISGKVILISGLLILYVTAKSIRKGSTK